MTHEIRINQQFAILAATAFYGPNIERSFGRPVLVRAKKAHALWQALPEPERTATERIFANDQQNRD